MELKWILGIACGVLIGYTLQKPKNEGMEESIEELEESIEEIRSRR